MHKVLPLALFLIALAAGAGSLFLLVPESERAPRFSSPDPRASSSPNAVGLLTVPSPTAAVMSPTLLPLRFTPLPPMGTPLPSASPIMAAPEIAVFEDLLCEPCARQFTENLLPFIREVGEGAVIRFHTLPTQGASSELLAKAAYCADQAEQGLAFRQSLYNTPRKDLAAARAIAAELGIPAESFADCLESAAAGAYLQESAQTATKRSVIAVPTTVIGTERLEGSQPVENLRHFYKKAVAQNQ